MLVVALLPTSEVEGIPSPALYKIYGTVSDAVGRPLASVVVNDGGRSATTNASGYYEISERATGTFVLTASRTDLVPQAKSVSVDLPLDTRVDFPNMLYNLVASASPRYASTASSTATVVVSVTSFAPNPGQPGTGSGTSCVRVTDSRTGTTHDATHLGQNPDGSHRWELSLTVPARTTEGTYTATTKAVECASGTRLSTQAAPAYTIDNTPPTIDPSSLSPPAYGNTIFATAQPLVARLSDGLSGVDPGRITFTLSDEAGSTSTYSGSQVSWNWATGWAKTPNLSLVTGRAYSFGVAVTDLAGNSVSLSQDPTAIGGGFLVTTFGPQTTRASIPPTPCVVSDQVDLSTGMKTATCSNVPLHFDPTSVAMAGTRHWEEVGFVEHTGPLESAVVRSNVGGVPVSLPAYQGSDPAWAPKTGSLGFEVPRATRQAATYSVEARDVNIGTLATKVPATWTEATLEMAPTSTTASTSACADPSAATPQVPCVPDPVHARYRVLLAGTVSDPAAVGGEHAAATGLRVRWDFTSQGPGYAAYIPFPAIPALLTDTRVRSVGREADQACRSYTTPVAARDGPLLINVRNCAPGSALLDTIGDFLRRTDANGDGHLHSNDYVLVTRSWVAWIDQATAPGIVRGLWRVDAMGNFVGITEPEIPIPGTTQASYKSLIKIGPNFLAASTNDNHVGYKGLHVEVWEAPEGTVLPGRPENDNKAHWWSYSHVPPSSTSEAVSADGSLRTLTFSTTLVRDDCPLPCQPAVNAGHRGFPWGGTASLSWEVTYTISSASLPPTGSAVVDFRVETALSSSQQVTTTGDVGALLLLTNPGCRWKNENGNTMYDACAPDAVKHRAIHRLDTPRIPSFKAGVPGQHVGTIVLNGTTADFFDDGYQTIAPHEDRFLLDQDIHPGPTGGAWDPTGSDVDNDVLAYNLRSEPGSPHAFAVRPSWFANQPLREKFALHFNAPGRVFDGANGFGSLDTVLGPPDSGSTVLSPTPLRFRNDFYQAGAYPATADFDRPGVFRDTVGTWYLRNTNTPGGADISFAWASPGDKPLVGDWGYRQTPDGPWIRRGVDDAAVFRSNDCCPPVWHFRTDGGPAPFRWANPTDTPLAGDFNGDGFTDIAVFQDYARLWYFFDPRTRQHPVGAKYDAGLPWGEPGDLPVAGDWNGDGRDDIGVFRPSTGEWWLREFEFSASPDIPPPPDTIRYFRWASPGDIPVAGDWSGRGRAWVGVFRPSTATWYLRYGNGPGAETGGPGAPNYLVFSFANGTDRPVAGAWTNP